MSSITTSAASGSGNLPVGIDLGTTNSCVATVQRGLPMVLSRVNGARTTPSVVAYTSNGILVGEQARRQALLNPANTIFSAKRLIGRQVNEVKDIAQHLSYAVVPDPSGTGEAWVKVPILPNETQVKSPIEIGSEVLKEMTRIARDSLGSGIVLPTKPDSVITCPAYFNDTQRKATERAGQMAGLNVMRIINEPTAAALLYNFVSKSKMKDGEIFAVFDLGGGTYDVSILQHTLGNDGNGVFNVLSTSGDTELGGDDWDNVLLNILKRDLSEKNNIPEELITPFTVQKLKEAAEQAKKDLSKQQEVTISLPFIMQDLDGKPINLIRKITRKEFENASASLFKRLEKPCRAAMRDASVLDYFSDGSNQQISKVLLVGGMTKMPAVKKAVRKIFNIEGSSAMDPDEAVALGAAVQGAVLGKSLTNVLLLDVTPLSLGIETMGGAFSPLIKRNTTIPVKKSSLFSTAQDNQSSVKIKILQGEREIANQNHLLGEFELTGIPPAPRGVPKIDVTFEIDENGIVSVSARDQASGIKKNITIAKKANVGLTDEENEKYLKSAEKFSALDKKLREIIESKNDADGLVYSLNDALTNLKAKLPKKTQEKCDRILTEASIALSRCDMAIKQENNENTLKTEEDIKAREAELQDTLVAIKRARDKAYKMTNEISDTLFNRHK